MEKKAIRTGREKTCSNCAINNDINYCFSYGRLFLFYAIAAPSFLLGGFGITRLNQLYLVLWVLFCIIFFFLIEIRVLCSHCPHYAESKITLRCWANYGAPKLWKYRPEQMNLVEKIIMITGFVLVWGLPAVAIFIQTQWFLLGIYLVTVILFFLLLGSWFCSRCSNLTCPLNRVKSPPGL